MSDNARSSAQSIRFIGAGCSFGRKNKNGLGVRASAFGSAGPYLPLCDNRRRGFTLTDILRTASDAQESQYRSHY